MSLSEETADLLYDLELNVDFSWKVVSTSSRQIQTDSRRLSSESTLVDDDELTGSDAEHDSLLETESVDIKLEINYPELISQGVEDQDKIYVQIQ